MATAEQQAKLHDEAFLELLQAARAKTFKAAARYANKVAEIEESLDLYDGQIKEICAKLKIHPDK